MFTEPLSEQHTDTHRKLGHHDKKIFAYSFNNSHPAKSNARV